MPSLHTVGRKGSYRDVRTGAEVDEDVAVDDRGMVRDGYSVSFSLAFMDSVAAAPVRLTLRDAAGKPTRLHDATSGATLQLNDHLIAAIETEARKEGLTVDRYVADVLRYVAAPTTR